MTERRYRAIRTYGQYGWEWAIEAGNHRFIATGMSERMAKRITRLLNDHSRVPDGSDG